MITTYDKYVSCPCCQGKGRERDVICKKCTGRGSILLSSIEDRKQPA